MSDLARRLARLEIWSYTPSRIFAPQGLSSPLYLANLLGWGLGRPLSLVDLLCVGLDRPLYPADLLDGGFGRLLRLVDLLGVGLDCIGCS